MLDEEFSKAPTELFEDDIPTMDDIDDTNYDDWVFTIGEWVFTENGTEFQWMYEPAEPDHDDICLTSLHIALKNTYMQHGDHIGKRNEKKTFFSCANRERTSISFNVSPNSI